MDAVCWLLDCGTPPEAITWIRSSEPWTLNRASFQPGEAVLRTFEVVVTELEAFAECYSSDDAFARLEEEDLVFRIDESVEATTLRGATVSRGEVEQLRRVENVVRLGHVRRVDRDSITLEQGSIPTSAAHVHVHCAAAGLRDNPPRAIFTDDAITLQPITRVSLSLSSALIGFVEASGRPTTEKNALCRANAWFHTPFDWARHLLTGMKTEMEWQKAPEVVEWVEESRLNILKGLTEQPDTATLAALQGRFLTALFPALERLDKLAESATPAERARIYEPGDETRLGAA